MQAFKNYITTILNRVNTLSGKLYKEDPAVFCWELANEAISTLDQTGEAVSPFPLPPEQFFAWESFLC